MEIRPVGVEDLPWVRRVVSDAFASTRIVSGGVLHVATDLPGFLAEEDGTPVGLLLYHMGAREFEVVVLLSLHERTGVATYLLAQAEQVARGAGCRRLWLVTTNDHLSSTMPCLVRTGIWSDLIIALSISQPTPWSEPAKRRPLKANVSES